MRKLLPLLFLVVICGIGAQAQYVKVLGTAEQAQNVTTTGLNSASKFQRTFPSSTITVYYTGTTTTVPIYSDAAGSVKSNPFTATSLALYDFFITPGTVYDVRISGTGVTTPFTRAGYTAPGTLGMTLVACGGSNDTTLLDTADTAGGTIEIPKGVTCASNSQTISAALQIDNGGLLKPITGQTVTLTGPQIGEAWQRFTNALAGQGTISFTGNHKLAELYAEWWGAIADSSTDCGTAFNATTAALNTLKAGTWRLQAGTYATSTAIAFTEMKSITMIGAGPDNTTIVANSGQPAVQINGLWRSRFQGIQFKTSAALATKAVFELDGNYDGSHTQGVQGITVEQCFFDAANLAKYAFALCRQGTASCQGSENIFANDNFQSAIRAGYYQEGSNALNNLFLGGNWQDMPKYGVELNGGSATFIKPAIQSLVGLVDAIANGAYDFHIGVFGTGERITIVDADSESALFLTADGGAQTALITGLTQRGSATGDSWAALTAFALKRTFAGTTAAGNQKMFKVTTAGTTGASQPVWPESGTVVDGTVTWTQMDFVPVVLISGHVSDSLMGRGAQAYASNSGSVWSNNRFTRRDYKSNPTNGGFYKDNYMLDGSSSLIYLDNPVNSVVTVTQITSNQNNYTPTNGNGGIVRLSTDASRNITGLLFTPVQVDGEEHVLVNVGAQNIVLKHQDAASTAANRFLNSTGADITIAPNQSALLKYDATNAYWRVFAFTAIADAGAANNFLTAISTSGIVSKAQPSSSNLSDASNIPLLNAANAFSGTMSITGALTPAGGVAASSGSSVSPRLVASCGVPAITSTQGTDATPVNTETYIVEVFIPANATVTGVALLNGSAVAGNVKISLATAAGVPIGAAVTASTAQTGTAVYQLIPFAVAYAAKGPATYYILVQLDTNTTPRLRTHTFGTCGASKKTGETYGTFTTVTPPTTFTASLGPIVNLY